MKDEDKTKEQLIDELVELRRRNAEPGALSAEGSQAEKTLRDSEERYRALVANIPDVVWTTDSGGKTIFISRNVEKVYGFTPEEIYQEGDRLWLGRIHPDDVERVKEVYASLFTESNEFDIEYRIQRKDGHWIWLHDRSVATYEKDDVMYADGVFSDITERRRAEEELREHRDHLEELVQERTKEHTKTIEQLQNEITERKRVEEEHGAEKEFSQNILNTVVDTIFVFDPNTGKPTRWNKTFSEISGYTDEEIASMKAPDDWYSEEDLERAEAANEQISQVGQTTVEMSLITKDGRRIPTEYTASLARDVEGEAYYIVAVGRNVTERRQAEEALQRSEERLKLALEAANDGLYDWNMQTHEAYFSPRYYTMLGYEPYEMPASYDTWANLLHPDDREYAIDVISEYVEGKRDRHEIEFRMRSKHGGWQWILSRGEVIERDTSGKCVRMVGTHADVTKREQAEEMLGESEEKFRLISEQSMIGIVIAQDYLFAYANQAASDIFEYSIEEMLNWQEREYAKLIHPDDISFVMEQARKKQEGEEDIVVSYPWRAITKTGKVKWVKTYSKSVHFGGKIADLVVMIDITGQKQAEEALRESEAKYRGIFDNSMDAIYIHDLDGRFLDANKAALDLLGYTEEEIRSLSLSSLISDDQLAMALASIRDVLEGNNAIQEYIMKGKDDKPIYVETLGTAIYDKDGKPSAIQGIARNVTQRKRMEEELLKIQKLESVGVLAGGIAHDLNNLLTGVVGNISLARMYDDQAEKDKRIAEAEKASMQIRDLTQQLLTFAKGGAPILHAADIGELLEDSASFVLRGSNVGCEFSIPDNLWPVKVDEGQINQVINNLVINAQQAMPEGGNLRISAENINIDTSSGSPLKAGAYIKVSVADQGIGISPEHLQRIFDPFFSTKHSGSGLGLASAFSIIQKHNGHITAESRMGEGSTFYIYLPAIPEAALVEKQAEEEKPIMGTGRILVMDDEGAVRETASAMLYSLGYEVTAAINGAEAAKLYKEAMETVHPFDAVILDLTVPGSMGGKETIKKLKEMDPEVNAIVSSGYSNDPIMGNFEEYGFKDVIAKPYKVKELSEALHRVIAGNA